MNRCLAVSLLVSVLALCPEAGVRQALGAQPAPSPKSSPGVPAPAAQPPASFHGIAWGTPLADIKGMAVVEKNGPAAYAKVPGLPPRIAEVEVTEVVYAFCNDLFSGAMATFQGKDLLEALRAVVAKRYGQPVTPGETGENVGWPLGDVMIMLEYDAPIGVGVLSYLHAPTFLPCKGVGEQTPAETIPQMAAPATPPKAP
jgi:hypothetical protein